MPDNVKDILPSYAITEPVLYLKIMSITYIIYVICFYLFYFVLFDLLLTKKPRVGDILLSVLIFVSIIILKLLSQFLPVYENSNFTTLSLVNRFSFINILSFTVMTLIQGGTALGFRSILGYFEEKKHRKDLEQSKLKSDLNVLRTQVNPHFLFNTLNNIDALIKKNPDQASDLVVKLSEEMRYMLYDSDIDFIEINKEVQFLKNYISLQEIRIRNKEFINLIIDIAEPEYKVAPMLFIPLVENAFKHCKNTTETNGLVIIIKQKNDKLFFSIENEYEEVELSKSSSKTGGIGLKLVKERFELIYPKHYTLDIQKANKIFKVTFSLF